MFLRVPDKQYILTMLGFNSFLKVHVQQKLQDWVRVLPKSHIVGPIDLQRKLSCSYNATSLMHHQLIGEVSTHAWVSVHWFSGHCESQFSMNGHMKRTHIPVDLYRRKNLFSDQVSPLEELTQKPQHDLQTQRTFNYC